MKLHAALLGESHGVFADQHDMLAFGHHVARQLDRVGDAPHGSDRADREIAPIHDRGIHLRLAPLVEHRPAARIEHRVVLQQGGAGLHRLQRRSPQLEHRAPMLEDAADALQIANGGLVVPDVRERARTTVNHQRIVSFAGHLRYPVLDLKFRFYRTLTRDK